MNAHVSNFLEALTFADECGVDTTALRADAERIIADFLAAHGPLIAQEDATDMCEGAAAFGLALALTIEPSDSRWLQLYADNLNETRAQRMLTSLGYVCAEHSEHVVVGGQQFDGFAAAANAMSISY